MQRLHQNQYHKLTRTGKAGKMKPALSLDESPLKVVDYYKDQDSLPDDYEDKTYVGSKPKYEPSFLDYGDCEWY